MKKEGIESKLSPQEYRKILESFDLKLISLDSIKADVNRDRFAMGMKTFMKDKVSYETSEKNIVNFSQQFELIVTEKNKKDFAVKITCVFSATFAFDNAVSNEFLDIFAKSNIYLNTWPYFRELVQNTILRMGLPPLTLPLLKNSK